MCKLAAMLAAGVLGLSAMGCVAAQEAEDEGATQGTTSAEEALASYDDGNALEETASTEEAARRRVVLIVIVMRGESLRSIAQARCGDGRKWRRIWWQNRRLIHHPGALRVGMRLRFSC
jgi:nucleoid-associated protein YgaU